MATTLSNARIELSKQMQDYWGGTTTSTGATTTVIDTGLMAKSNDWINDEAYDLVVTATSPLSGEERKISSLANTTGTLTTLAHSAATTSSMTYEVHRLFTASEKRTALVWASHNIYPSCFKRIRDESRVSGNWLKDGSFEVWTSTSALTYWTTSVSTLTQVSTAGYFKTGTYSAELNTAAGYIEQKISNNDDLKRLAGKTVTFTVHGWCDTASCLRIGIYDGTTTTYSSYHDGDSTWTEDSDPLIVSAKIADHPTTITFRIYLVVLTGTVYVDDARVITSDLENPRIYIGDLGFSQNEPIGVFIEPSYYSNREPWNRIHNYTVDYQGYLYLPDVWSDFRLRLEGIGYLDFLASGVASTAWTATIDLDQPQTEILYALAAYHLCQSKSIPNDTAGDTKRWQEATQYWAMELQRRKMQYAMALPLIPSKWSH
jgi:hypothetical protein